MQAPRGTFRLVLPLIYLAHGGSPQVCVSSGQGILTPPPPRVEVSMQAILQNSMPNMIGRPGCRTMEPNGGSSVL